jgi:hypothetical protein
MPVSLANSRVVYEALKKCGIDLISALPEPWLVHMIRMAKEYPEIVLVRLSWEELARYRPKNLVHVIFDNESLLSAGGFPTATATGSDLAAVACASGIPHTQTVRTLEEFTHTFDEALHRNDMSCTAAKVEALGPIGHVTRSGITRKSLSIQTAY